MAEFYVKIHGYSNNFEGGLKKMIYRSLNEIYTNYCADEVKKPQRKD